MRVPRQPAVARSDEATPAPYAHRLVRHVREDVHIHAPPPDVFERVADLRGYAEWLPPAFSDVTAEETRLSFALAMPRRRASRLDVTTCDAPAYLELIAGDEASGVSGLAWAVRPEGAREVHLTVEAAYLPPRGVVGALRDAAVHAPMLRQALRDALWRLKLTIEGTR